ncbi:MAG: RHS repeat domain-containing protein, partial [Pyrinomonadaceae bacterium]
TFGYDHRGRLRSATDADGVSLRYDYDRAGKLIAVRRDSKPGLDLGQYLRASFTSLSSFSPAPVQDSCAFGGDGWFDGDTFGDRFGMNCGDPFGGFDDGGGGMYGIDPSVNWCLDCMARKERNCDLTWRTCYTEALGASGIGTAGCAAFTAGAGAIFCAIAFGVYGMAKVYGCQNAWEACMNNRADDCFKFCPRG